jgi:hypothetical protein
VINYRGKRLDALAVFQAVETVRQAVNGVNEVVAKELLNSIAGAVTSLNLPTNAVSAFPTSVRLSPMVDCVRIECLVDERLGVKDGLEHAVDGKLAVRAKLLEAADGGLELVGDGLRNKRCVLTDRPELVALQDAARKRLAKLQNASRLFARFSAARLERLIDDLCGVATSCSFLATPAVARRSLA